MAEIMQKPRIYADFNKWAGDGVLTWFILTCWGTVNDLTKLKIELTDGLEATFYTDDSDMQGNYDEIEVDGYAHFDAAKKYWVAIIDWKSLRHESDRK
jgi:hypothetical protein